MARNRGLAVAGEVFVAAALRTSRSPSLPPLTVHHAFAVCRHDLPLQRDVRGSSCASRSEQVQSQRTQGSQRITGNQGDVTRGFTRGIGRNFLGSAGVGSQAMANVPSPVDADAAMAGAACMVLSVAHWHATKARVARALPYPPMASLTALLLLKLAGGLDVRAVSAQTLRGRLGRSLVWTPCRGFSPRWGAQSAAQVGGKGSGLSPMAARVEEEGGVCTDTSDFEGCHLLES